MLCNNMPCRLRFPLAGFSLAGFSLRLRMALCGLCLVTVSAGCGGGNTVQIPEQPTVAPNIEVDDQAVTRPDALDAQ
ncbi:MAG: hypothetical protein KDA96_22205 [Planctomycetaceae bacterium]|nr:hypothetical protein [Planctomycetaceae bacterium]